MKDFNSLSGPWKGMSIQDGTRIEESIKLTIRSGIITGEGTDKDGEFELVGDYREKTQTVRITRRYITTRLPGNDGAGIPYDYTGTWDGSFVSGEWASRHYSEMRGPFEMWPNREEDRMELAIELGELSLAR